MEDETLESVIEDLATFIELKQQNLIITAWIQLKKHNKFTIGTNRSKAGTNYLKVKAHYDSKQHNYIATG